MKTWTQMLRELARADVTEFAVLSGRLPCVKIGDKYEPIDDSVQSTEAIFELLVSIGGGRYLDDLEKTPARWVSRVEGAGPVEVHAVMRSGRVQARLVPTRPAPASPAPTPRAEADAIELAYEPRVRAAARSPVDSRVPELDLRSPNEPTSGPSDPMLRAALVGPPDKTPARAATGDVVTDALLAARDMGASDVHVVAGRALLVRLAGELVPRGEPLDDDEVTQSVLAIVPERLRPVLEEHGSCDFAVDRPNEGRFRVNVARQRTGLKACFRCIAPGIPTLASLGLPPEIERATHHHQGLVLVTGPTGHGKTNTLSAIVDIINRETTHHVITVEDPVEYVHPRKKAMISQREVGSHTRSFASALKGSLREDPDVIVVGELRDTETVRMALAASETGHLVLGTMNTPSAAKTIDRLIDLFPPADQSQVRMTLAGGLHLVVGQRLLPTADGKGMVAAAELLPGSIALWSLIRDAKTFQIPSLQQRGKGFGILRLDESLADLVHAGRVTRDAALACAENPDDLQAILDGHGQAAAVPEPPKKPEAAGSLLGKAGQIFGKRGA